MLVLVHHHIILDAKMGERFCKFTFKEEIMPLTNILHEFGIQAFYSLLK
jgi:hypothetical protein